MNNPAHAVDPLDVFRERCEARALLWAMGVIELQDAVDVLQVDAEFNGLVDELGQDAIQQIIACTFRGRVS